jgi:hypothetical protein
LQHRGALYAAQQSMPAAAMIQHSGEPRFTSYASSSVINYGIHDIITMNIIPWIGSHRYPGHPTVKTAGRQKSRATKTRKRKSQISSDNAHTPIIHAQGDPCPLNFCKGFIRTVTVLCVCTMFNKLRNSSIVYYSKITIYLITLGGSCTSCWGIVIVSSEGYPVCQHTPWLAHPPTHTHTHTHTHHSYNIIIHILNFILYVCAFVHACKT